jgi:6,7-dimethyl-8-ribityllumazine synthase
MKIIEGKLAGKGLKVALVVSRFNEFISSRLKDGALDCLKRHDVGDEDITIVWTPGSYEIPLVAKKLGQSGNFGAVICLGAIIRGQTPHFDFIAAEAAKGIAQAGLETGCPMVFGIVTCDTLEQAIERAGTKSGNKGFHAAQAAIELVNLYKQLP